MKEHERRRCEARSAIFKALGHPTRIYILERLREAPHCVCELTELVGADTSTISKHLSVLKNAGLVRGNKTGTTIHYQLSCSCLSQFLEGAETLLRIKADENSSVL